MVNWEYIASGLSYVWKHKFDKESDPLLVKEIRQCIDNLCAEYPRHKFGVLFNGYTEKHTGEEVKSIFEPYNIQVDSGGLQMITLGRTITEEMKDQVYQVQGKYGTIGHSFDKIPVKLVNGRSDRTNMGGRLFDPSLFDECAIESGKNLARQIESFIEQKTKARPMMIIQGNNQSWYQKWADIVLKQVPQSHWEYIYGISSGGAVLGQGLREDVERVWTLSQLEVPDSMKKNFHLLGFGSMNRLIPVIEFEKAGVFQDGVTFSYDSTKHTGGCTRGQTQDGSSIVQMSRNKDKMFYYLLDKIGKVSRDIFKLDFDEDHFFYTICCLAPDAHAFYGGKDKETHQRTLHSFIFMMYGVWSVMKYVDLMEKDDRFIAEVRPRDHAFFYPLKNIKTQADFDYWKRHASKGLNSKPVPSIEGSTTLEDFFV